MSGLDLDRLLRTMSRKQIDAAVNCTARINILTGAVSAGKTVASLLAFLDAVNVAPKNGIIAIVGRTIQTIERNIIEPLQQDEGPFGPFAPYIHHTSGANVVTVMGRKVHLIGANDVKAEGRIRGATACLIYVDELTLIPESFFTMCLSRLRVPGAKLIGTTNPDGPQHWLRQKFLLREGEINLRHWHFTLDDNPWLTREYVEALKSEYTGLFYKRFILGNWVLAEGAIYDSWDPDVMVVDELPPILEWVACGVDYGTTNPFAAELIGLGSDGRLYLASEWYYASKLHHRQMTDAEYAAAVVDWLDKVPIPGSDRQVALDPTLARLGVPNVEPIYGVRPRYTVIDPSAASFRIALHQAGIQSVMADNAVLDGIRLLASLMATDRFRVHRSCKGFIDEAPGYSWDEKAAEKGEDAPVKVADHALDGARYGVNTTRPLWQSRLRPPAARPQGALAA